jgi:CheY-like chemotaxis protein
MHRILVVDDDQGIRTLMDAVLSRSFDIKTADGSEEALRLLGAEQYHMVIADINMPAMNGIELCSAIKSKWPGVITVLMTGYDINTYLQQARENGVANIIAKTAPLNFAEIEAELSALLNGTVFGLSRYLLSDGQMLQRFEVRSSEEARAVRRDVSMLFKERFGAVRDIELVVDEIVSNALYHAPAHPDGSPKYAKCSSVNLEQDEYVQVDCGFDSEKYGVSVTDRSGRLTKEIVLERIARHTAGKGLLDLRGRGIHLSRMLSDRMIVNIKRGERTEVILLNYFQQKYQGAKPLYINEL